jgi:TonB family protein
MVLRLTSPSSAEPQGVPEDGNGSQQQDSGRTAQDSQAPKQDDFSGPRDRRADPKMVGADLALDLVLKEIIQQARLSTMATGAFIGLAKGHKLVGPATSGSNAGDFVAYLNRDRRVVDTCFRAGEALYCRDAEASEEFEGSTCRYLGAKSVILVPILGEKEKKLGIFGVFSPHVDAFSGTSLVALQSMSQRIVDVIAQIERSTSNSSAVSAGSKSRSLSDSDKPSPSRDNPLRSALSGLGAAGPALWGFGILAILLLVGWTVSRAIGTHPATVPSAAAIAAQPDSPLPTPSTPAPPTSPVSAHPANELSSSESGNATANSKQTPAAEPAVKSDVKPAHAAAIPSAKPNASAATDIKKPTAGKLATKPVRKISAGTQAGVPDLEIENALDDASFEPPPPSHGNASKGLNQPGNSAGPRPAQRGSGASATSLTSALASSPASALASSPSQPPSSSPSLVPATREAIRIAKDPEPGAAAVPPANGAAAASTADPSAAPPVTLLEWSALSHVAQRVEPDYPPDAKAQHTQGTVVLNVVVGTDGRVQDVTPVDGDHPFVEAAIKAMHQWRFTPFLRNGQAARFESQITFKFVLP